MFLPKAILITGGAGFIGVNYIHVASKAFPDAVLINLDALTYAANRSALSTLKALPHYHFIHGNINNKELLANIFQQFNIDTVIHLAAESHVDRSIESANIFVETNINGTVNVLEQAKQFWFHQKKLLPEQCRFIHVSTDEVYGSLGKHDAPFTEESPYQPNSPYAASKAAADHMARAYCKTHQLPVIITHCSNNYGPYQHPEKLIPKIINACMNRLPIPIYGDGSNIRDWIYVGDHCEALNVILTRGEIGEVYNIGGSNEMSNLFIAKKICNLFDELYPEQESHQRLIKFAEDRPGHDWRYAVDSSKLQSLIGKKCITKLFEGLGSTLKFYKTAVNTAVL